MDVTSSIEAMILSFLFCRSGWLQLTHSHCFHQLLERSKRNIKAGHRGSKEDCIPLRYASILISKGFFCSPPEIGMIIEIHLKMVNAVDSLLSLNPQSEEFLWVV
ncbi:hypothetical protein JHK82_039597 [Glycine max]|uniref:Uncharacterized protein n=2 Tax=Glycine subgen. Soja TaxID=1462606 RepID=K7M6D8_SOYBN|nr:hypothetical protein JHK87_039578 [Glycine soja]KAG4962917.1 hypothetical protein JHK86_039785 [Glycine max]KAG4965389.1 hypothetical protein JHK85_040364 [Glycine max]KAG5110374.1 hypothetical protein JHK82_039597 [Glycine max]KAG5121660.1 hypothetical protein JHK84_040000 [Glycine max]